uniref:Facilitated trehalose transporter Tret1 n=1 Tax=Lygus hesperus TaxID=30085 RepID=A0A146MC84_LYGHE
MILFGSYSGGLLSESSGRRKSLLAAVTPSIVGWIVTGTCDTMTALISGFLLLGIGMGLSNSCAGVYLTELEVTDKWRRVVSAAKGVAFSFGITFIYVLGSIIRTDWKRIALISCAIPSLAFVLGIIFLRESRVWLRRPAKTPTDKFFCGLQRSFWSALVDRVDVYRFFYPFSAVLILFQLSGATVLITFAISLLDKIVVERNVDPYVLAIGLGLSHMIGPVLAEVFSSKFGVRRTLVYSGTLMSLSILFIARLHRISGVRIEDWPLFTAEAFIAFFVCSSSVFTSVTGSQQERIFPVDVRRACCNASTFNSWVGSCVAVVTYPVLAKCWGFNDIFMIYSICCVLCAVITIMLLPDVVELPPSVVPVLIGDSQQLVTPGTSEVKPHSYIGLKRSKKLLPTEKPSVQQQPVQEPKIKINEQPSKPAVQPPYKKPNPQPKGEETKKPAVSPKLQATERTNVQPQGLNSASKEESQKRAASQKIEDTKVQRLKTQIKEQPPKLTVQPREQKPTVSKKVDAKEQPSPEDPKQLKNTDSKNKNIK